EEVRIAVETGHPLPTAASPGEGVRLPFPQRHESHLGRSEHAADHDEQQRQADVGQDAGHRPVTPIAPAVNMIRSYSQRSDTASVGRFDASIGVDGTYAERLVVSYPTQIVSIRSEPGSGGPSGPVPVVKVRCARSPSRRLRRPR